MPMQRFGQFEIDLDAGELHRRGEPVHLPPQAFKVLALLVRHGGGIVTRVEIREQLWGTGTHVEFDQGLNFCIRQVREALGDHADSPQYIETLPRRGYRLLTPVASSAVEACTSAARPLATSDCSPRRPAGRKLLSDISRMRWPRTCARRRHRGSRGPCSISPVRCWLATVPAMRIALSVHCSARRCWRASWECARSRSR